MLHMEGCEVGLEENEMMVAQRVKVGCKVYYSRAETVHLLKALLGYRHAFEFLP